MLDFPDTECLIPRSAKIGRALALIAKLFWLVIIISPALESPGVSRRFKEKAFVLLHQSDVRLVFLKTTFTCSVSSKVFDMLLEFRASLPVQQQPVRSPTHDALPECHEFQWFATFSIQHWNCVSLTRHEILERSKASWNVRCNQTLKPLRESWWSNVTF